MEIIVSAFRISLTLGLQLGNSNSIFFQARTTFDDVSKSIPVAECMHLLLELLTFNLMCNLTVLMNLDTSDIVIVLGFQTLHDLFHVLHSKHF